MGISHSGVARQMQRLLQRMSVCKKTFRENSLKDIQLLDCLVQIKGVLITLCFINSRKP